MNGACDVCLYHLVPVSTDFNSKSPFFCEYISLEISCKATLDFEDYFWDHVTVCYSSFAIPAFNVRRLTFYI